MRVFAYAWVFFELCLLFTPIQAADSTQFRGPKRDGRYDDTGLLKRWPPGGPKLLWFFEGLGGGYSTVSEAGGIVYATGMSGQEGFLYALSTEGKLLWRKTYGQEANGGGYPGARSTPTIDEGRVYVISGHGRLSCFDAKTGAGVWSAEAYRQFQGQAVQWSHAESVLVDGNKVFCTPGGPDASVAALDKKTGKAIWTSKGLSEPSGYCSPTLVQRGNRKLVVTLTSRSVVGVDAETGKLLWRIEHPTSYDVHAVTPVHSDGMVYYSAGYGSGGGMLQLSPDGSSVTSKWRDQSLDCHHHGLVLANGIIYGTSHKSPGLVCMDLKTGRVLWQERGPGQAGLAYADGMLYAYENRRGIVHLIQANPQRYVSMGTLQVQRGDGQHWAHPVIANGRLYIRHGDALMAYDVKSQENPQ
ncbi:MAG: PQQ-like beta-propeller repeat protein [Planctomycetes bacterium]|nr:PQQ-like beta-propeller repeat protein [Planctomycetota bacterium]